MEKIQRKMSAIAGLSAGVAKVYGNLSEPGCWFGVFGAFGLSGWASGVSWAESGKICQEVLELGGKRCKFGATEIWFFL